MTLRELRTSPGAAWAGPLLIFSVFMLLKEAVKKESAAEWYRSHPEQWVFPLQAIVTLAAIAFWWKSYRLRPFDVKVALLAAATGVLGIAIWLLPSWLYTHGYAGENEWLGFTARTDGFDPTLWQDQPGVYWSVVGMRFLRLVVVVAFAEELFWRGFLWRLISDPYRDFSVVPFGQRSWKALGAVVVLFTLVHAKPDYLAAVIFALLVSGLYVRTKSVGACVLAHAVANLVLGIYVMATRQWGFW